MTVTLTALHGQVPVRTTSPTAGVLGVSGVLAPAAAALELALAAAAAPVFRVGVGAALALA